MRALLTKSFFKKTFIVQNRAHRFKFNFSNAIFMNVNLPLSAFPSCYVAALVL